MPKLTPESRFVLLLSALVQLLRLAGTLIVIWYPDALHADDPESFLNLWDGFYYNRIALDGYYRADGTLDEMLVNFSPLYPLLIRGLGAVVTPTAAPFVMNTAFTAVVPYLAAKLAEKFVPGSVGFTEEEIARRRHMLVIGITLNPLFMGYSIYNLTEAIFYALLLAVLNCSLRAGWKYVAGELVLLYFLGMTKFVAVVICVYYAYQMVIRDFSHKQYKQMWRPLACIAVSGGTFLLWGIIIPIAQFGISASAATTKYWGVQPGFPVDSLYFWPKIGIIAITLVGMVFLLRMLAIRERWSLFGFYDKYCKDLQADGQLPAPGALWDRDPFDYALLEPLLFYGLCVFGVHGLLDPLFCFYRYVSVIIPFFASLSIVTRRTGGIPHVAIIGIVAAVGSNLGVMTVILAYIFNPSLPRDLLPTGLQASPSLPPDYLLGFGVILAAMVLFLLYFRALPGARNQSKKVNERHIITLLAVASLCLMVFNLYMP